MKYILIFSALLLGAQGALGQATPEELAANPERTAGIYHSYEYVPTDRTPAPKGFTPFYISHYGRHGSRWYTSPTPYVKTREVLRKASEEGVLTPKGADLLARVEVLAEDARDRYGDLSPRGAGEHRGIAERMYAAYPEVFSTKGGRVCRIESRSTLVPRCILSMAAFNERLKELDPSIRTTRESSQRYMNYMSHVPGYERQREAAGKVADSLLRARVQPARLLSSLFSDEEFVRREVKDSVSVMKRLYELCSIAQDADHLGIRLYDAFTPEELFTLWECANVSRYLYYGPSVRFGDDMIADAKPLLKNIVTTAQEVVDGSSDISASLRFGHDTNIIPLLALLQIEGASDRVSDLDSVGMVWNDYRVTCMGTNLQLIFYRNKAGDVLVKLLHNEREARIPLPGAPYYRWEDFREYCESKFE